MWSPSVPLQRGNRPLRAITLAVLLVAAAMLAGCPALSSPDTTPTETDQTTTESTATASTATEPASTETATPATTESSADVQLSTALPESFTDKGIESNATWNRTLQIVGQDATQPSVAVATDPVATTPPSYLSVLTGPQPNSSRHVQERYSPEERLLLISEPTVRSASRERIEAILAHGYAHAVQEQQGWRNVRMTSTTEPGVVATYREGFASYVEGRYAERYPDIAADRNLTEQYEHGSTFDRYYLQGYLFGRQYFDRRVTETGSLAAAAEEPPPSTEQVLHDTTDGPRPLEVRTNVSGNWSVEASNPRGELATRIVLRDELPRERAIRAAGGWGADRLYSLDSTPGGESGYVWVHRWDTTGDAEEFASAAAVFLEERRAETDLYAFDVTHPSPETTVLVFGTDEVPASTTVTAASNGTVSLHVGD